MEPKMKVLIGYDGSENAERMIEDLKWAGLPDKVNAVILSAADVFLPLPPEASMPTTIKRSIEKSREHSQEALRVARSLSEHGTQEVKKAFPRWKVSPESCADSPVWALVKKAEEWKADLIVVGAHGHSQLGRFLGSVSQMTVVHSSHSVRIARPRPNPNAEKIKILVGVDGSAGSASAIEAVANRQWPPQTEIFLMSVIEPKLSALLRHLTPPDIQWILEKTDDERTALGHLLESYAKKLRPHGWIVTCRVEAGDPKRVLIEHAETWQADSIFLGARGLGNLKRFLIGGVSSAVSAQASCSVEVIRA